LGREQSDARRQSITAIGAFCPLRRILAIVSFLNPEPTPSFGGGNRC